jgi:hypothetical protein
MALRVEELLVSVLPRVLQQERVAEWLTPIAEGCPSTGCPATACPTTDCGSTGCTSTGCGATQCGTTGCGTTGCGTTSCGSTGCGSTGCGTTGCGSTGCGSTNCGSTGGSANPGCPGAAIPNFDELVNPADALSELRSQLAGINNLVSVSRLYKTSQGAGDEKEGVSLEKVVELEKTLAKAIAQFHAG